MSERDQTMPDLFAWQESPDYVDDEPQEWWIAGWEKGFERGQEALRSRLALQEAESVRLLQYARRAQSLIETVDRVAERQGDDQFVYFYNLPSGPWHGLLACARDFPEASHRTALLAAVLEAAGKWYDFWIERSRSQGIGLTEFLLPEENELFAAVDSLTDADVL